MVSGSLSVLLPSLRTNGGSEGWSFCGNYQCRGRGVGSGGMGFGVIGSVGSRLRGNDEGKCGNDGGRMVSAWAGRTDECYME